MNKHLRAQLHKALDFMIDSGELPVNDTYELTIQAYKAPYGQPEDHISKGYTVEVDEHGIQSGCEFEEDVNKLHTKESE